ncbi:MAG: CPBP family intramembrane metalloprotease [Candidatus Kapabacteria bacterium]|nr:CPBP family intramembrane metalloprotease [Candidatus Kapabacteria bacterium]
MIKVIIGCLIATVFWFLMFFPATAQNLNFWAVMIIATSTLTLYSLYFQRKNLKELFQFKIKFIFYGIFSAFILYLIFYFGNFISQLLFDFANHQISNIYKTKDQADNLFIGLALFLLIGPAEEIFWRGFVQNSLEQKYGAFPAYIIATLIYGFVHIWAFNLILLLAALICGFFWGFIYMKTKSLLPVIISHSLWDLFIFIIIPINN